MSFARAEIRRALKAHKKAKRREEVQMNERWLRMKAAEHRDAQRKPKRPVRGLRPGEPDTRDDKYLHSHARGVRGLVNAMREAA